jgi:GTPase
MLANTERMLYESEVPVFQLSAVTGTGFDEFLHFLRLLRKPYDWANHINEFADFCIDEIFNIHRVGLVVNGIVLRGSISVGDNLLLGPFSNGDFRKVKIRSIHVHRTSVKRAGSGQSASLAFKRVKKGDVRKGMALVHPSLKPLGCMKFEAEITLLEGFKTIQLQHEPVLHIGTVNQSARITELEQAKFESIGAGVVQFEFKHQPEYIRVGSKLVFREGSAKGVGTVSRIVEFVGNRIDDDEEDIDI